MKRQQWLVFVPVTLATAGLAACASVLGGEEVKVRPVDNMQTLTAAPRDALYESAVSAINERDYGRALEYLQAAKAKDPRNVKALNALGVVYDKLGRFDLSARYYAQARTIEPDSKIVAENMGYSRILQHLLDPNQPVAVASIDLPPGLINPASSAGAPAPVVREQTSFTADLVPVLPVAEKKVIDAPSPTVAAVPLGLPDARHVFADVVIPVPVTETKLIDAPPPTVTAMPLGLPDARYLFADVVIPVPVTERRLIDTAPPAVTAAPFALPDTRPLFTASLSPAVLSLSHPGAESVAPAEPVASAATMMVVPARPAATAQLSLARAALVTTAVEQKAVAGSVPSAATAATAAPVSPQVEAKMAATAAVAAVPVAKPVPVASHPPGAERAVDKKAMVALVAPAVKPPVAKPIVVAIARPVPIVPTAQPSAKPAAAAASVRSVAALPAKTEKPVTVASVSARPAVPVLPARQVTSVVPVKLAAAISAKGKVLTIGQPIKLVNASGKPDGAGTVLRRLTSLGWTMRPADSRAQPATMLFYPVQNLAAAKAMQRTLPFPVRLVAEPSKASGMRLVIGRDYLSWKPRNSRIAVLWQKRLILASVQKPSLRGVR